MSILVSFAEGEKAEKPVQKSGTGTIIETKPVESVKKIPDIQPSKTHKSEPRVETKKHETKIVVHSIVEENVVKNSKENLSPAKREVINKLLINQKREREKRINKFSSFTMRKKILKKIM